MVLGCFICRQPLIKRNRNKGKGKLKFQANALQGPNGKWMSANIKMDNPPAQVSPSQSSLYQPMVTRCGHIFHRGCLKKYISETPVRFGGKIECPVCLKVMSLSQCFNIYLDAMPSGVTDPNCMYEQLEKLDDENEKLHVDIGKQKNQLEELDSIHKETRAQINRVGKEIMRKSNELKIFDDYCKKTGGLAQLQRILEDPARQTTMKALEAQNEQLRRLIKEHKSKTAEEAVIGRDQLQFRRQIGSSEPEQQFTESRDTDDDDALSEEKSSSDDEDYLRYHASFSKLPPDRPERSHDTKIDIRKPESPEFLSKIAAYLESFKPETDPEDSLTD